MHGPYRSVEEPLDVLFIGSGVRGPIEPFSVGISIGSAKCMAALTILHIVIHHKFSDPELLVIADELGALCVVRATTDPSADVFEQAKKTLSKKIRVSDRTRPSPIQMDFAFSRVLQAKVNTGDKRKPSTILAQIIKEYNGSQTGKSRLNPDERSAVLMLHEQLPEFKATLKAHWRNFPVSLSAIPVSFLALPWLDGSYDPLVKKTANPLFHQIQTSTPQKNLMWLRAAIGRFQHRLKELSATGKSVNLRGTAQQFRAGVEQDTFYFSVGVFAHFEGAMSKCCGVPAFEELQAKFLRGALERELGEKAKTKDPALAIEDFRFVQSAMEFDPSAAMIAQPQQEALTSSLESSFKLDTIVAKAEQECWSEYVRSTKAFNASTQNAKISHLEALV